MLEILKQQEFWLDPKICLTREDIANLSNMTTANAIRTLSNFATEGIVELDGKKIIITDKEKLEQINNMG